MNTVIPIEEKFWRHVDKLSINECWLWKGNIRNSGYGHINHKDVNYSAHRISWVIHNGYIVNGELVLHKCDNKLCVNPNHLYLGTYSDNNMDREKRNPGTSGRPSKIGIKAYTEIIDLYSNNIYKQTELSILYNISRAQVSRICNRLRGQSSIKRGY